MAAVAGLRLITEARNCRHSAARASQIDLVARGPWPLWARARDVPILMGLWGPSER